MWPGIETIMQPLVLITSNKPKGHCFHAKMKPPNTEKCPILSVGEN